MSLNFYGKKDRNTDGSIKSEMPGWYFPAHLEDLKDDIAEAKTSLNRGGVPPDQVMRVRQELEENKARLGEIERSKPKPTDNERNLLWKGYKELGNLIQESMFTYTDMQKGTAPAHTEAFRMTKPIIELPDYLIKFSESCNVKMEDGKISRNGAAKIFKLFGRVLGEPTNIEVLRKDRNTVSESPVVAGGVK